jgi:MOSC domain-containing protein YiiM
MAAHVHQLNISPGGVPKLPVERVALGPNGLVGDDHDDKAHHGGPDRAVCLYALERIEALRQEGHPVEPGHLGENVTVSGLDWDEMRPGARLRIGPVLIEVTRYTTPCRTIRGSFSGGHFNRIHEARRSGWSRVYARVVEGGEVARGDAVEIVRPAP